MKETQRLNPDQVQEVRAQHPATQQNILFSKRIHPGMKVWEYNFDTKECEEAIIEKLPAAFKMDDKNAPIRNKVVIRDRCIYDVAINKENAMRKFKLRIMSYVLLKVKYGQ